MRALDVDERDMLAILADPAGQLEVEPDSPEVNTLDRLYERGCAVVVDEDDTWGWYITDLGRLALRVSLPGGAS